MLVCFGSNSIGLLESIHSGCVCVGGGGISGRRQPESRPLEAEDLHKLIAPMCEMAASAPLVARQLAGKLKMLELWVRDQLKVVTWSKVSGGEGSVLEPLQRLDRDGTHSLKRREALALGNGGVPTKKKRKGEKEQGIAS
jgi:hypothetical protein